MRNVTARSRKKRAGLKRKRRKRNRKNSSHGRLLCRLRKPDKRALQTSLYKRLRFQKK